MIYLMVSLFGRACYNSFTISLIQISVFFPFLSLFLNFTPLSPLSFLAPDWGQEFSRGKTFGASGTGPRASCEKKKKN